MRVSTGMRTRPSYKHGPAIIQAVRLRPESWPPTASGSNRAPKARARWTGKAGRPEGQAASGRAAIP